MKLLLLTLAVSMAVAVQGSTFLTSFDVLVQTSPNPQTLIPASEFHDIEITFTGGMTETLTLTGLPSPGQAKLFTFNVPNQQSYTIFDVDQIAVKARSNNGWKIQTIVTTFTDNDGHTYSGSIDRNVNRWIQLDNVVHPEYESYILNLSGCY